MARTYRSRVVNSKCWLIWHATPARCSCTVRYCKPYGAANMATKRTMSGPSCRESVASSNRTATIRATSSRRPALATGCRRRTPTPKLRHQRRDEYQRCVVLNRVLVRRVRLQLIRVAALAERGWRDSVLPIAIRTAHPPSRYELADAEHGSVVWVLPGGAT